ncbi:MAG: transaldolase [Oligoflexia bacterium]|nr:transaldolase [Oligoflexia bacterium]
MKNVSDLKIKLYSDGANKNDILEMYQKPYISGFTTNPTLMKKAGITDYRSFCLDILQFVVNRPISFEVFADDFEDMRRQALEIKDWGKNVFVKIPVTNTSGEPSYSLIESLANEGVGLNVTAVMTLEQVTNITKSMANAQNGIISVFAGRIADTGRDPIPVMKESLQIIQENNPALELLWASPRELLNIFQADDIGCHIITATPDILKKLDLVGKKLAEFSLETVKMFYEDACRAGYFL